jgi:hypothetical protein
MTSVPLTPPDYAELKPQKVRGNNNRGGSLGIVSQAMKMKSVVESN